MPGFDDQIRRLEEIAEELADLAIDRLRESLQTGNQALVEEEKQISRARRSVEKAAGLLAGMPSDDEA